ncbi:protein translocase subunit SecF [Candidatus Dependentiae bacterium]|nr:protein translocase subunit SecF [Candidatus Dependentiae bacterium]
MIDFLKYRSLCAAFSVLIFTTFIGTYIYKYQQRGHAFNYSVDFTGGTQVLFGFSKPVSSCQITNALEKGGFRGVSTREFSDVEHLVRVKEVVVDVAGLAENMKKSLEAEFKDNNIEIKQTDSVGSGISAKLRWDSFLAIVIGLILMLLYIALRFWSFAFATGAVLSLFHDAVVILAIFLLFDKEISINVIMAILTILGYSINDTIVIFAKIRENLAKHRNMSAEKVVNLSINETLRRTTLTSFATLLVVISLFLFGGEVLRDLSLALLIGIVFGTYSSIYIASPIMLLLYKDNR